MQEVVELCTKSRADRPEPLQESPTLASRMERPDEAQAVTSKPRMMPSNPVTLALLEIVYSFAMDNLLVS